MSPYRVGVRAFTDEQDVEIARQFRDGMPLLILTREWGSRKAVMNSLHRSGIYDLRPKINPGRRLFTPEQDAEIGRRFAAGESQARLNEVFGGSRQAIVHAIKRAGVYETRDGAHAGLGQRKWTADELAEIQQLWDADESRSAIAKRFRTKVHIIDRALEELGAKIIYRSGNGRGESHPLWRGGRSVSEGYVRVLADPTDPIAWEMRQRGGYVPEHRLVMARALNRPLLPSETVHHINGNTADNRLENLQLRQGQHGAGVIHRCRTCGSHDIETVQIGHQVPGSRKRRTVAREVPDGNGALFT